MHEINIYFIIFEFFTFKALFYTIGALKKEHIESLFNIFLYFYLFFFNVERIEQPTTAPIAIDTKYIGQLLTVALTTLTGKPVGF